MKKSAILLISLGIISCGGSGGSGSGNGPSFEPLVTEDPCSVSGACTDQIEIKSLDDFSRMRDTHRVPEEKYTIGKTYEYEKTELLNSYDSKNDKIYGNCTVNYTEKKTLYRVDENYSDQNSDEPYDRFIYKNVRSNITLLTDTEECKKYLKEKHEYLKDGTSWSDYGVGLSDSRDVTDMTPEERRQAEAYLKKHKFTFLKYKGRAVLRTETRGPVEGLAYYAEWTEEGGYVEKKITTQERSFSMSYLDDSFLGDIINVSVGVANGSVLESESNILRSESISEIDLNDIPPHYRK